ncbi:MAG: hypothetical protein LBT43_14715, partial [Prevotella sp.]|nr:hypothetical protein [Prevotella sp.]
PGYNNYIKITEFKINSSEQTVSIKYETTTDPAKYRGWRIGNFKLISEKHYKEEGEGLFSINKLTNPNPTQPYSTVLGICSGYGFWPRDERWIGIPTKLTSDKEYIFPGETVTYTSLKLSDGASDLRWTGNSNLELISTSSDGLSATFKYSKNPIGANNIVAQLTYYSYKANEGSGDVILENNSVKSPAINQSYTVSAGKDFTITLPNYKQFKKSYPDLKIATNNVRSSDRNQGSFLVNKIDNNEGTITLSCKKNSGLNEAKAIIEISLSSESEHVSYSYDHLYITILN